MTRISSPRLATLLLVLSLPAAELGAQSKSSSLLSSSSFEFGSVPIHTRPAHPTLGAYGVWAAGANYKVSFHDGFAFHLYGLGEGKPAWRWRTVGVRMGKDQLLGQEETPKGVQVGGERYEYHFARFVERYDLSPEGAEQSFVILRRPDGQGDLELSGAVTSPLDSTGETTKSGSLVFGEVEGSRIEYGTAIAIDAKGQTVAVARKFEKGTIRLIVPGGWLAEATFPVTVDPFVSGTTQTASTLAFMRIEPYSDHRVLVAVYREGDAFVFLSRPDLGDPRPIFASLSGSRSVLVHDAAFVDSPRRWVVALADSVSAPSAATIYIHDGGDTGFASGVSVDLALANVVTSIALGGTARGASGDEALLCVGSTAAPLTSRPSAVALRVDARTRSIVPGSANFTSVGPGHRSVTPRWVVSSRGRNRPWLLLYTENILLMDFENARLVTPASFTIGPAVTFTSRPVAAVETQDSNYLIAARDGTMWRGVASGTGLSTTTVSHSLGAGALHALAFDPVANQRCIVLRSDSRPGYRLIRASRGLCVIEEFFVHPWPRDAAYDPRVGQFVLASSLASRDLIVGYRIVHDRRGGSVTYGTGCGGSISSTHPYAGSRCFVGLRNARPSTPAMLMVSPVRRTVPFGPGCELHIDTSLTVSTFSTTTSGTGTASAPVDLPDCPVFVGQLYAQWVTQGSSGFQSSSGLQMNILP